MMKDLPIGPTGRYPQGKIHPDDAGELTLAVAADPHTQRVMVSFGCPVGWLGLTPREARALAALLLEKAKELES